MANKRTTKQVAKAIKKASKSKYFGVFLVVVIIMVVAFAAYCYLNPEFYNSIFATKTPLRNKDDVIKFHTQSYTVESGSDLNDLKVHMVDVGQGDAIIIQLPDGSNVLIDAGKSSEHQKLLNYIDALNIEVFDVVLLTHSDEDHIGGADEIFANYVVKNCYRPYVYYSGDAFVLAESFNEGSQKKTHGTKSYGKVLDAIYNEQFVDDSGQSYYCNWEFFNADSGFSREINYNGLVYEYKFDFLTPTMNFDEIPYSDLNDFSPYVLFTYGEKGAIEGDSRFDLLLTGDAEKDALAELLDVYSTNNLDVDVLKAGHHGLRTSTTQNFLNKIKPEHALISCGTGNSYGHPHQEILDLFVDNNTTIWRTDIHENIVLNVSETGNYFINYTGTVTNNSDVFVGGVA